MLNNLKNLIRNQKKQSATTTTFSTTTSTTTTTHKASQSTSNTMSPPIHPVVEHVEHPSNIPHYKELSPRYQIIDKIGEGAFSKVYKAIDNDLQLEVAIKIMDKSSMSTSQIENVYKEISIMRRLDHPNVVKLYNYINTKHHTFLIIEYISGGELFNQIVKYTYFSEDLSRHIIIQVVKAIDYLHSEIGVVHRDIKPENLLFESIEFFPSTTDESVSNKRRKSDDDSKIDEGDFKPNVGGANVGIVKLADFGLSKILWDSNTKTPCGTASYTAPEIVKDEAYSKSVDMWAIGCVLYTLLCGFPPFYDTDPNILTTKVAKGEYTFLSPWWDEISKEAKDLVSHLLTVDPIKRYGTDEFLNHPWILNNDKPTTPAFDAPIYKTFNHSVLRFEETIPIISSRIESKHDSMKGHSQGGNGEMLSPRAEALKFAFDTGMNIQRTATPLRRLLEEDAYFDESDEDSDSEDDDDDDGEDDDEDDEDDEDDTYTYHTIHTKSPVLKKFPKTAQLTPHHFKYKPSSLKNSTASTKRSVTSTTTTTTTTNIIRTTISSPVSTSAASLNSSTSQSSTDSPHSNNRSPNTKHNYQFKQIDGFNLKFDGNTLLNRRKMSGSLACGPVVK